MDGRGEASHLGGDAAPGEPKGRSLSGLASYLIGFSLATALTGASFWAAGAGIIYAPAIPIALGVLAIAQMGVHLVFFLHITTARDNTNNVLALAFGVLIVTLVGVGSLWIMAHLDNNMMPTSQLIQMQR